MAFGNFMASLGVRVLGSMPPGALPVTRRQLYTAGDTCEGFPHSSEISHLSVCCPCLKGPSPSSQGGGRVGADRRSSVPVMSTAGQGSAPRARPVCARGAGAVGQATVAVALHVLVSEEEERKVRFSRGTKLTVTSGPSPRRV